MKTNIFFVHGPLVLLVVKRLLETNNDIRNQDNYCFIFFKNSIAIDLPHCKTFIYKTSGIFNYVKSQIDFLEIMNNIELNADIFDVYLSNPFHFSTNYALYSSEKNKAYLIEDGMANYYDARLKRLDKIKMMLKEILGWFTGLKYRRYEGHITAYDSGCYSAAFVFSDNLLVTDPGHVEIVPGFGNDKGVNNFSTEKVIVVLDQDVESIMTKKDAMNVRTALYSYLGNMSGVRVFYKKHPSQKLSNYNELKITVEKPILIESDLPIEMLVEELSPCEVISFVSSALVTLSDSYPGILCTSVGYNLFNKESNEQILKLLKSRNIQLIPV